MPMNRGGRVKRVPEQCGRKKKQVMSGCRDGRRAMSQGRCDKLPCPERRHAQTVVLYGLVEVRVVPVRELCNELGHTPGARVHMDVRLLVEVVRVAGGGVVADRDRKVRVVLIEDGDCGVEVDEVDCADVVAVEEDVPCGRVVEAHGKLEDRALARAVGADYDEELAREELERDVLEGILVRARVLERDVPTGGQTGPMRMSVEVRMSSRLHLNSSETPCLSF